MKDTLHYGCWSKDEAGLPCFDGRFLGAAAIERPFTHGFSSGRLQVLVNRQGLVRLFTTEGGYTDLCANTFRARSGLYLEFERGMDRFPLIHDGLATKLSVRYGIGYARYSAIWRDAHGGELTVEQEFYTPPDKQPRLAACFRLTNSGDVRVSGRLRLRSDVVPGGEPGPSPRVVAAAPGSVSWKNFHSGLGDFQLRGDATFGSGESEGISLLLSSELDLAPGESRLVTAQVGYGCDVLPDAPPPETSRFAWAAQLGDLQFHDRETWMGDEAVWSAGQLYSYLAWDNSVGEHYLNLGGYGWVGFGAREVPETALAVAGHDPALAFGCLRWTAKIQYANGDIPHCHAFRRPAAGETLSTGHNESDNEIWFVLACAEVVQLTENTAFFDEELPFWEGETATVWEHLRRAVRWIFTGVGLGSHGLIRIADGDWNDYLSLVGARGFGESMMNTGMACRALDQLIPFARARDPHFARECEERLAALRTAATAGFDRHWFVRGYTDEGAPFGTLADDRVFLNAQSWCVLGGCGTPAMRESAMRAVLAKCRSAIGLTLVSRPYPSPPPPDVSTCPIPPGEGENSGIWPQTVHWAIWALCELGWRDEAEEVWKLMSLRNHATVHPEVPFGIFNGPDCYSSHHAGEREGWTQVEMLERAKFPPMNPMVAWQSFSLSRIGNLPARQTPLALNS
ncbi:GH36-type glycosyl hydrolase domain-containing protein [Rariglobus hedericola]|uniref:Glycosyl hydrolase 94 catalytic domain-containing protein n=1 Tax=Rariglobus hedericola TaxID=2597822 RepID=A0A556QPI3_9BACT|nr:hypothetical protein [Rariglobus hedericola]TSJ78558.1 hypothetical protein FPL22_04460 [Rariglobus hedericola]